nr:PD40 domain-containing protein [Anaerolineae bacterium]
MQIQNRSNSAAFYFIAGIPALMVVAAIIAIIAVTAHAAQSAKDRAATATAFQITLARTEAAETPTRQPDPEGEPGTDATATPSPTAGIWPGGQIVFTCFIQYNDQLCVMDPDGSNYTQITEADGTDWYASFSPDGSQIVFSSHRSGIFHIYSMKADGSEVTQLTDDITDNYAPEISPDGSRIVFTSTYPGNASIYVMDIDGSNVTQITTDPGSEIDPTWSPDGTQIAFAWNKTGTNELYIMNADGTNIRQVTSGSNMQSGGRSDWSPDGEWLAFYAGPTGDKDIYMVPAVCAEMPGGCGSNMITRLTRGGNNKAPAFSPDGAWIVFASNISGANEVWIMRADGTDWRQLTFNAYADWQPRWGP